MEVKLLLRFGTRRYFNGRHWIELSLEELFEILSSMVSIKSFSATEGKEMNIVSITMEIEPISLDKLRDGIEEALKKKGIHFLGLRVVSSKVRKNEIGKYKTALLMKKIEGRFKA